LKKIKLNFRSYFIGISEFVKKKKFRKYLKILLALLATTILLLIFCYFIVVQKAKPFLYSDLREIPENKVGLILGTSKNLGPNIPNPYFYNRINAAFELFKAGKVKYLLVSGDNRKSNYNEPADMKNELINMGIPDSLIVLDYAGLRTFDSMIRSKEIFGQSKITVISQKFHNERAIYIALNYGIQAVGYNAKDVDFVEGLKTMWRELFARVKLFIDIYITHEKPRFLGEKIEIK
jgi:SanA protein